MKQNISPVHYKMYSATCFLLAGILFALLSHIIIAKTIELDERIPFIPKLKRKAGIKESQSDIRKAEIKILEACNWNPLYTTIIEVLEFYLAQGVVFSSD